MRRNEAAGEQYDLQLLRRERRSRRRDEFDELSTTFPSPFGDELRLPPRLSHMSLQRPLPAECHRAGKFHHRVYFRANGNVKTL